MLTPIINETTDLRVLMGFNRPEAVALIRKRVRRSLLDWCVYVEANKKQHPAEHHRLIIDVLERATRREPGYRNVILLMPPGAAKSTYTSIDFPPWYLAQFPTDLILACSYSYSLVEGFGRQCRDLIDQYQNDLGYKLSPTAAASGDWRVSTGGGYFCAGVGSGVAGHRADLGFIDDYLGSQEDADSETIREKQWQWYHNDFWPRLKPNAIQIIIANRRHEEDLVGKLLKSEPEKWLVIRLPYFAEENDPLGRPCGVKWNPVTERTEYNLDSRLWPEWFDENHASTVLSKEPRVLAGLFQQRPAPEEGNFFRRHMLVGYNMDDLQTAIKNGLRYYVGADYAVRKGQENDRTCFIIGGVDQMNRLWVLPNWFWEKVDTLEAVEMMFKMTRQYKPISWWLGKENITGVLEPFINKMAFEKGYFVPIEELSEAKDKQAKAQAIKARMSQKAVLFPKWAPTWNEIESELLSFPGGSHDDFVDALAKLGLGLDKMVPAEKQPEPAKDIAQWVWTPTIGNIKKSHNRLARYQKMLELDK